MRRVEDTATRGDATQVDVVLIDTMVQSRRTECLGLIAARAARELTLDGVEAAVLPLSGGLEVEVDGRRLTLEGRDSVFAKVTDCVYLPVGAHVRLTSRNGCDVAVPTAVASG